MRGWRNPRVQMAAALIGAVAFAALLVHTGRSSSAESASGVTPAALSGFHLQRLLLNAAFLVVTAAYVAWLVQPSAASTSLGVLMGRGAPFLALALLAYPASRDVRLYLHYGQMGLQGLNPYRISSGDFASIFLSSMEWKQTSTYGPLSELIFMVAAWAAHGHPVVGVYVFKVFCLGTHLANAGLIWRLLDPGPFRSKLTLAYLIHPSLLSMHVAEAHLDVFLCTWVIVLAGCLCRGRFVGAVGAAWGGALTKTVPIVWLPLIVAYLVGRRRWKEAALAAILSAAVVAALSASLLPTWTAWRSLFNPASLGRYARSIYQAASLFLDRVVHLGYEPRMALLRRLVMVGTVLFLLGLARTCVRWYARPPTSAAGMVADLGWVILALLVVATPWVMPWYPTILIPLGILSGARFFGLASLVFALSMGLVYGDGAGTGAFSLLTSLSTLVPVILVLVFRTPLTRLSGRWAEQFEGRVLEGDPGPGLGKAAPQPG